MSEPNTPPMNLDFPSKRGRIRNIRVHKLPFGEFVPISRFKPEEVGWIQAQVKRVQLDPALWVPALMAHNEVHRQLGLQVGNFSKSAVTGEMGYVIRADLLASWNVYEMLWRHYLQIENHSILAAELQKRPYEAKVLLASRYFGGAIAGFETAGSSNDASSEDEKVCPFCAETIKARAVICRYCRSDLPR